MERSSSILWKNRTLVRTRNSKVVVAKTTYQEMLKVTKVVLKNCRYAFQQLCFHFWHMQIKIKVNGSFFAPFSADYTKRFTQVLLSLSILRYEAKYTSDEYLW